MQHLTFLEVPTMCFKENTCCNPPSVRVCLQSAFGPFHRPSPTRPVGRWVVALRRIRGLAFHCTNYEPVFCSSLFLSILSFTRSKLLYYYIYNTNTAPCNLDYLTLCSDAISAGLAHLALYGPVMRYSSTCLKSEFVKQQ